MESEIIVDVLCGILGAIVISLLVFLLFFKKILRMRKAGNLIIFKNYWDVFFLIGGTVILIIGVGIGYSKYNNYQNFVNKEIKTSQLESSENYKIIEENNIDLSFVDFLKERQEESQELTYFLVSILMVIGGCLGIFFSLRFSYVCNKEFGNFSIFISILVKIVILFIIVVAAGLKGKQRDEESGIDYHKRMMMAAGLGGMLAILIRPGCYQETDDEDALEAADILMNRDYYDTNANRRKKAEQLVGKDGAGNFIDED